MRDATLFARQWAGLVAQTELLGRHGVGAQLIETDGMVAAISPDAPATSLLNCAMTLCPDDAPHGLNKLAERYRSAGTAKWGLWVDADNARAVAAATDHGMVLDSQPTGMVAALDELPFADALPRLEVDLAEVGRINDVAYGLTEPKLAPKLAALSASAVLSYGACQAEEIASVAAAYDVGDDTSVWFVATHPRHQRKGLCRATLRRLLLDARERGQATASLQSSAAGSPVYEQLGFKPVGGVHLYEERF